MATGLFVLLCSYRWNNTASDKGQGTGCILSVTERQSSANIPCIYFIIAAQQSWSETALPGEAVPGPQGDPPPMGFFNIFNSHSAELAREHFPIPARKVKKKVQGITESANTNCQIQ